MPSVIIPAHNEAAIIGDCLRALLDDPPPGLEVIVSANACSDRTAEIARGFGDAVRVIETDTPGKTNALNLAERETDAFPRAFIDGDIVLQRGALARLFAGLGDGAEITAPMPTFDQGDAHLSVRLFYASLIANPYFGRGAPNGSGIFVVSERGRSRWGEFPAIIADDLFVRLHFDAQEMRTIDDVRAVVRTPRTLGTLVRIKARSRLGVAELQQKFPDVAARRQSVAGGLLGNLVKRPTLWPAAFVYAYVRWQERRIAARMAAEGNYSWLRDDDSRGGTTAP